MEISPGAVIAGRYRADRKIGAGSMGEVWAGENVAVGYKVAIKTMLDSASVDPEVVVRFRREALILGRIRSEFVARVLDFASDENYGLVLILDLIEGEPFSKVVRRTRLTVEEAIEVGCDIVSGLVDLHRANIVHRDLKPGNIILEPRPDGTQRAIIVDFGVSRLMKGSNNEEEEITNITRADMALGTLEYMAPEQMLDSRNVTGGSDVYAVGAILYRAVAGKHAFGDLQDVELARTKLLNDTPPLVTGRTDPIAKEFELVVARALRRRPADRYKRAEDMLADLVALRDQAQGRTRGRRSSSASLTDEQTVDETIATVTTAVPIDVSTSFELTRKSIPGGRPSSPSVPGARPSAPGGHPSSPDMRGSVPGGRASVTSHVPPTSSPAPPISSPGRSSAPTTASAPPPPAAPAATRPSSLDEDTMDIPPPRAGVSPVVVTLLVIGALGGGIALGATVFVPRPLDPVFTVSAPSDTTSALDGSPGSPAGSVADGGADASSDAASDASLDGGSLDGAALDGSADAAPLRPFPPPTYTRPGGGPLPGSLAPPPSAPTR